MVRYALSICSRLSLHMAPKNEEKGYGQSPYPINPILRSIPQHEPHPQILPRPAHDHFLHKCREHRRIKLQALLLPGYHAHEKRYPLCSVFLVLLLTLDRRNFRRQILIPLEAENLNTRGSQRNGRGIVQTAREEKKIVSISLTAMIKPRDGGEPW